MSTKNWKLLNKEIINSKSINYFKIKTSPLSPRNFNNRLNNVYDNNNIRSIKRNKLSSLSLKNRNYSNEIIFSKREKAFNKSIELNKSLFKYNQYSSIEENDISDNNNKRIFYYNRKKNNSFSPLYLTESILKPNKSMSHFGNYANSSTNTLFKKNSNEYDINNDLNKDRNLIFKNYIHFGNKKKKINMKLINKNFLLKTFEDDIRRKEKIRIEEENKTFIHLIKKSRILNVYKGDLDRKKYISNINEYLTYKKTLNFKREQAKNLDENIKDEINFIDDKIKGLNNNYNLFKNDFMIKYSEFIKELSLKMKLEKIKNDQMMDYINELNKKIGNLKLKVNKIKYNLDAFNKLVTMLICIKEKKIELPKYYKIILENKMENNKNELKNISKSEIERILNYKKNLIYQDPSHMMKHIKIYENNDIDLLKRYNSLRDEIKLLNEEKDSLMHAIYRNEMLASPKIIESKKNILLNLKKKYYQLNQHVLKYYFDKNKNNENNIIKHTKLYYTIVKIINNLNKYIKCEFKGSINLIKEDKEKELIIANLSKLELMIDSYMNDIVLFKRNNPDKINLFHSLIEKQKKIRKINEQKKLNKLAEKLEKNKINKKYNKFIVLPSHKINSFDIWSKELNSRKFRIRKEKKAETIGDYLSE